MKLLARLLLKEFIPLAFFSIVFFALMIVMADLFANLWRYLNQNVPINEVLTISLLYIPRAISWALPVGALFGAAYSLGVLGSRNELIAVFGIGIPLHRFVMPLLIVSGLLGIGGFFFEDKVAIPLTKTRNTYSSESLGIQDSGSNARVTAIAKGGEIIYHADYYDEARGILSSVTVLELDENKAFFRRIDAFKALWNEEQGLWIFENPRFFTVDEETGVKQTFLKTFKDPLFNEAPETFRRESRDINEMDMKEAISWIAAQRKAGFPYRGLQAEFYQRFTTAFTPFLVVFFAGALGGRFRRNVLLMSLLMSLVLAVGWYVGRMIATLLSRLGVLPPLAGALLPLLLFFSLGVFLFKKART